MTARAPLPCDVYDVTLVAHDTGLGEQVFLSAQLARELGASRKVVGHVLRFAFKQRRELQARHPEANTWVFSVTTERGPIPVALTTVHGHDGTRAFALVLRSEIKGDRLGNLRSIATIGLHPEVLT